METDRPGDDPPNTRALLSECAQSLKNLLSGTRPFSISNIVDSHRDLVHHDDGDSVIFIIVKCSEDICKENVR